MRQETFKPTAVQREILAAMASGSLLVQDRQNVLSVSGICLQPTTRAILIKNRLIERLDKSRNVGVQGNGFVITAKGAALVRQEKA